MEKFFLDILLAVSLLYGNMPLLLKGYRIHYFSLSKYKIYRRIKCSAVYIHVQEHAIHGRMIFGEKFLVQSKNYFMRLNVRMQCFNRLYNLYAISIFLNLLLIFVNQLAIFKLGHKQCSCRITQDIDCGSRHIHDTVNACNNGHRLKRNTNPG